MRRFPSSDERGDRGEGHLEAGAEQALRAQEKEEEGRPCDEVYREAVAVEEDSEGEEREHGEGALRGQGCSGEEEVGESGGDGGGQGPAVGAEALGGG